jgi:hypothetical protein
MRPEPNENRQLALSRLINRQLALSRLISRASRPHQPSRASGRF